MKGLTVGSSVQDEAPAGAQPSPDQVRAQMRRILTDPTLQASPARRELLRFVVEETLAGRADRLKGFAIALAVFGRNDDFDPQSDPVVRVEARRLRRDLHSYYGTAGKQDPVFISIPKGGYVPRFSVQRGGDLAPGPSEPHAPVRPRLRRLYALALAGIATLGVLAFVLLRLQAPTTQAMVGAASEQARGPAIIVLPFENLSISESDQMFARGLTEELIFNLMRFSELRLYSAFGSFQEAPTADPVELGKRLKVGYVIRGSVLRAPDQVRLIVHLIDASSGQHLWSETYDRALTPEGVFDLQEQLAADLASNLAEPYGIIHEASADLFRRERPQTLYAYECVLRTYGYRRTFDRALYAGSKACLQRAVQLDPGYADAWAWLAFAYLDGYRFGYGGSSGDAAALDLALSTARHAVEIDPDGINGLLALSSVQFYRREFTDADATHRRLLALNPTNPEVLAQVGWRTAFAGDWDEGMGYLRQATMRSIKVPDWYRIVMAFAPYRRGDYRAALAELGNVAMTKWIIAPLTLAAIQGQLGNRDEAAAALAQAKALDPEAMRDPRATLRMHNVPEDLIDRLVDGLVKAGLEVTLATAA